MSGRAGPRNRAAPMRAGLARAWTKPTPCRRSRPRAKYGATKSARFPRRNSKSSRKSVRSTRRYGGDRDPIAPLRSAGTSIRIERTSACPTLPNTGSRPNGPPSCPPRSSPFTSATPPESTGTAASECRCSARTAASTGSSTPTSSPSPKPRIHGCSSTRSHESISTSGRRFIDLVRGTARFELRRRHVPKRLRAGNQ